MIEQKLRCSGLPLVSREVGLMAGAELIRAMMDSADAEPIVDEIKRVQEENPELAKMVCWLAHDVIDPGHALAVMAFTVKLLRAQAEVDLLDAMQREG
jgi:hypothetical protein